MPARVRVDLRDVDLPADGAPRHTGPAVHALVLRALAEHDAQLAAVVHDAPAPKPLAVTPLYRTANCWRFEVGVADDALAAAILTALADVPSLSIGRSRWEHTGTTAAQASYEALANAALPCTAFTLEFRSPTTVRTAAGGAHRSWPLPMPDVLFGRLWDRWHHFAPPEAALAPATVAIIEHQLAVLSHRIHTEVHLTKAPHGKVVGFVGRVDFHVVDASGTNTDGLRGLATLVHYGEIMGIGDQTAKGMGWVNRPDATATPERRRRRPSPDPRQ